MIDISKRKFILIFVAIMFFTMFSFIPNVSAKTVKNLRDELQQLYNANAAVDNKIIYTEAQIKTANSNIVQLNKDIANIAVEMDATIKKIAELGVKINAKDTETKNLLAFIQVSDSNNIYVDYIGGAETLTDFIYRVSVTQQLVEYNDKLVKDMNQMIKESNEKKVQLKQQEVDSQAKIVQLNANLAVLGGQKQSLYEDNLTVEEEIKNAQMQLQVFINAGCKDNDDINICANKYLPPDTSFWRPLEKGYVTSEYGWRLHPIQKVYKLHDGMDLSVRPNTNVNVYAAASGKVSLISSNSSMGNYIYISHNINGKNFTTTYLHLVTGSIRVKVGDIVSKSTILATMGSTGNSTGPHLHFSIATGLFSSNGGSLASRTVNPRNYVNFPTGSGTWYDRVKKYN